MVCGIVCSRAVLYIVGIAALSVHITHIFSRREGRARHRHVQMYTCTHVHMYTFTFNAPDTLQADEAQQQLKRAEDALQLKRREEVRGVQCLCVCVCVCWSRYSGRGMGRDRGSTKDCFSASVGAIVVRE